LPVPGAAALALGMVLSFVARRRKVRLVVDAEDADQA
jgi:hypothetical protein